MKNNKWERKCINEYTKMNQEEMKRKYKRNS